jgi:hypothetical protein
MIRRLTIALALLLVAAVPALAAPNRAQVKAYLLRSPSVSKANKEQLQQTSFGAGLDRLLYGDLTGDGQNDVVATIFSGGTAGDIAFFVLSGDGSGLHTIKASNEEYKVGVAIVKHQLQVTRPIYAKSDPNCCPEHVAITTYRYDGTRLVAASKKVIKTPS